MVCLFYDLVHPPLTMIFVIPGFFAAPVCLDSGIGLMGLLLRGGIGEVGDIFLIFF